jgi:hypothetical protein
MGSFQMKGEEKMNQTEKANLLDALYDALYRTESEAAYEIIGNAIDFVKKA